MYQQYMFYTVYAAVGLKMYLLYSVSRTAYERGRPGEDDT